MPRSTLWAAGALAAGLLAACAGAPHKAKTAHGLAFQCDPGGPAVIRFSDGGYLPDATVRGKDEAGEPAQVLRSTAELDYRGASHRMVAEWAEQGLRYRSEAMADGAYLIWALRGEHARLGRRASLVPEIEKDPEGEQVASCSRSGRAHSEGPSHPAPAADHGGEPHRR